MDIDHEAMCHALYRESNDAFFIFRPEDSLVLDANPTALRLAGYPREELLKLKVQDLFEAAKQADLDLLIRAYQEARLFHSREGYLLKCRDGAPLIVNLSVSRIHTADSTLGLVVARDITERGKAGERLQEANRRLEEALAELKATQQRMIEQARMKSLTTIASGIAHNFNNALMPVQGFSELIMMGDGIAEDVDKVKRYAKQINDAAQRAAEIVKRLRRFYRQDGDQGSFSAIDLNRVALDAISLTEPGWRTQSMASGVGVQIESDLPAIPMIMGNETELCDAIMNLIMNSADAITESGTITIRTSRGEEQVALEVSDTGVGMTEEVLAHCLDPYFTTRGVEASGMGLAMVYGIVQRHGGTLDLRSEAGKGTTVRIGLPIVPQEGPAQEEEGMGPARRPARILVVDDEPTIRELVGDCLSAAGHLVEMAGDGREGLDKFQSGDFDLVIVDRSMPELNGDQLAAEIKAASPSLPIIMMTGFGDAMEVSGDGTANVDLTLGKPVALKELRGALAKLLRE